MAFGFLLVAMVALSLLMVAGAERARASTTFTVTNTADPGNGICNASGCTLREAIDAANNTPGKDTINFNIGGGGVMTIKPKTALPWITDEVIIDGYTQQGAEPNTLTQGTNAALKIELNGEGRNFEGLNIKASNSVVKGLVINRFDHNGIQIGGLNDPQNNRIEGNFIGTDVSGTLARGNNQGVVVFQEGTSQNVIGGTTPEARNLISGNDGTAGVGINLTTGNEIKGNLIGTKKNGTGALGNSGSGVRILYASVNVVGGNTSSAANTIAFNEGDGVKIESGFGEGTGNRIFGNSIFGNIDLFPDGLGIDLGDDGPTSNDNKDTDTGPNNLQNKPNLTSALTTGGSTTIEGKLNSTPNKTFKVQFFSNPPGSSEGKKYIGQKNVSTNANGNTGTYSFSPAQAVPDGQAITATATDPNGNTSEFSAPEEVV